MARVTWLFGLRLEIVDHGIFWENQTRRLLGIDGQDIRVATFKELSKEIRPSQAMFTLC